MRRKLPARLIWIKWLFSPAATMVVCQTITKVPNINVAHRPESTMESPTELVPVATRSRELRLFLFLTVVLAPMLAVAIVGSLGLLIWLYQMFMGPPTG